MADLEMWVAKEGSIFEIKQSTVKVGFNEIKLQKSIAFNVGDKVARHIVDLHNQDVVGKLRKMLTNGQITKKELNEMYGFIQL